MKEQLQQFVAGRSKITHREDDQGNPVLELETSELTPFRAKAVDSLAAFTTLGAVALSIYLLAQAGDKPELEQMIFALIAVIVSYPVSLRFWRSLLKTRTAIILTPDTIHFNGEKEQKTLSRMQDHSFSLRDHDKTLKEKRDHEFEIRRAQSRNQVLSKKPYYAESYHVVLIHMEQRHDLMEVFDKKSAHDVMAALKLCDNH